MGLPARADVTICFKKETPEVFQDANLLVKELKKFCGDDNCDIGIFELSHNGENSVYLDLYSERYQNLYWQQDLLVKYLKANCEIEEISTSVWTADDNSIYLTGEDLEEYEGYE